MRISAVLSTLLIALSGLPTSAQSSGAGQIPWPCTSLKPGNPRFSSGIGIVFQKGLSREVVRGAVDMWADCDGYGTDFPPFLVGREGSQTVHVEFVGTSSGGPRCGSFRGRRIVLYAFAVDRIGRRRTCRSQANLLAHELGHVLGLRDAPNTWNCRDDVMANLDLSKRTRRRVQPEECRAVGERWVTPSE